MNKYFKFLLSIITCNILFINVYADKCTSSETVKLISEANNVKVTHDIIRENKTKHEYDFFGKELETTIDYVERTIKVGIYNLTDNLYIVSTEKNYETYDNEMFLYGEAKTPLEYSNKTMITYAKTTNGNYSFTIDDYYHYRDYRFEIYSSKCEGNVLRTIDHRIPKYNSYSEEPICKEYPNSELCQDFITTDLNLKNKDFKDEVKKSKTVTIDNNSKEIDENERKPKNFFQKYLIYFIIGFIVIGAGSAALIVVNKRRSQL